MVANGAGRRGRGAALRTAALCLAVLGGNAFGQIGASSFLLHDRVLQCEAVELTLRITNDGAAPIVIGPDGNATIHVRAERQPGYPVSHNPGGVRTESVTVLPRQTGTVSMDISQSHALGRTGPYTIWASLEYEGDFFGAGRLFLDVVPGFEVSEMTVSVVDEKGSARRRISLRTLSRESGQHLYLRVDSTSDSICYGIFDLGRYLGFDPPSMRIDASGQIHVLHQSRPLRYTHSVHTGLGYPQDSTFYTRGNQAAEIRLDDEGAGYVYGVVPYEGNISTERPEIRSFNPFE